MSEWREQAACRGMAHTVFFPDVLGGKATWTDARAVCSKCPARASCLAEALEMEKNEPRARRYGFLGGMSPSERWQRATELRQEREAA